MQASVKEDREKWIGGSDIPAIMGISPFITRWDLLQFKAQLKENEFDGNEYTEYGNIMEPKIRNYINELYNSDFIEGKHENEEKGIRIHTDGENKDTILEIKTTSQWYDDINDYKIYLVQLLFYMMNTKKKKGMLAVYKRPKDFNEEFDVQRLLIYEISIDDYKKMCDNILEAVEDFKQDLEKLKNNPLLTEEDLVPYNVKDLSNKIIMIEKQMQIFKELEIEQKKLKEQLYKSMKENNIKKWETPNGVKITLVDETEDKIEMVFNENKFKEEQALMYASYCEEKTKKGRAGYIKITL